MNNLETLGTLTDQRAAETVARTFNDGQLVSACVEDERFTVVRALVERLVYNGAVLGYFIRVERRDPLLHGMPWGTPLAP